MSDRTQTLLVELERQEVEAIAWSLDPVEEHAPIVAKLRAALSQPEHQGDGGEDWPACEMAMVGDGLVRVRPGAGSHGYPTRRYIPAPVLSDEVRKQLNDAAERILTSRDYPGEATNDAELLRNIASREQGGETQIGAGEFYCPACGWRADDGKPESWEHRACPDCGERPFRHRLITDSPQPPAGEAEGLRERSGSLQFWLDGLERLADDLGGDPKQALLASVARLRSAAEGIRHERNFWRWKHGRREDEIQQLREELPPDSPNHLASATAIEQREPCDGEGHVHEDGAVTPCPGCLACSPPSDSQGEQGRCGGTGKLWPPGEGDVVPRPRCCPGCPDPACPNRPASTQVEGEVRCECCERSVRREVAELVSPEAIWLCNDCIAYLKEPGDFDQPDPGGEEDWPELIVARDPDGACEIVAAHGDDDESERTGYYEEGGFAIRRYVPAPSQECSGLEEKLMIARGAEIELAHHLRLEIEKREEAEDRANKAEAERDEAREERDLAVQDAATAREKAAGLRGGGEK